MTNYAALQAYDAAITAGSNASIPSSTPDAGRVAAINAAMVTQAVQVPTGQWEGYFLTYGFALALEGYATGTPPSGATTPAVAAARMISLMISSPSVPSIDMTNATVIAEVSACLTALVAEGSAGRLTSIAGASFAQGDMNNLLAMGNPSVSLISTWGWTKLITLDDLECSRDPKLGVGGG